MKMTIVGGSQCCSGCLLWWKRRVSYYFIHCDFIFCGFSNFLFQFYVCLFVCLLSNSIDVAVARMNVEILQNAAMEHSNQLYDKSENEVGISKSTGSTSLPSNKSEDIAMKKQLKSK